MDGESTKTVAAICHITEKSADLYKVVVIYRQKLREKHGSTSSPREKKENDVQSYSIRPANRDQAGFGAKLIN